MAHTPAYATKATQAMALHAKVRIEQAFIFLFFLMLVDHGLQEDATLKLQCKHPQGGKQNHPAKIVNRKGSKLWRKRKSVCYGISSLPFRDRSNSNCVFLSQTQMNAKLEPTAAV